MIRRLLVMAALSLIAHAARADAPACPVPPALAIQAPLPLTRKSVDNQHKLTILAIGTAPTAGTAAGGAAFAYPALLQDLLARALPEVNVSVFNRGQRGRSTRGMARHLPDELRATGATLVIWETGGWEAVHGIATDTYAVELGEGLDDVRAAPADLILLDVQFAPPGAASADVEPYRGVIHDQAEASDVPVLPRYDLMQAWSESGALDLGTETPESRQQAARRLFACLAAALADTILAALR
jgi:acyl-CoA thioesterase I